MLHVTRYVDVIISISGLSFADDIVICDSLIIKVMILISAPTVLHLDFGTNMRSQTLVQRKK